MMNVVGNVKQVVMIILSVFLFKNKMRPIGILGSVICITGSIWYSMGRVGRDESEVENSRSRQKVVTESEEEESQQLIRKQNV